MVSRFLQMFAGVLSRVLSVCGSAVLSTPGSHKQLSQITLYMFCRQKTGYFPGSQQKKSKDNLCVRGSRKALISTKTCSVVESLSMSDFSLCFVYAAAWWEKDAGEC